MKTAARVVVVLALLGLALFLFFPCWHCMFAARAPNHRYAAAALRSFAAAQIEFRDRDVDADGRPGFWTADVAGLYGFVPAGSTEMVKLIELSVAAADAAPAGALRPGARGPGAVAPTAYAVPGPKAGYLFRVLRPAGEPPGAPDPRRFAACAYPADYPKSGCWTLVVDESGVLRRRDLGRPGPPEGFPDAESLARDWHKLD